MSKQFEGVVRSTLERNYRGKKLYSFFLDGVDGLFKLGEKRPTFKEGAYVKFSTNDKLEVEGEIEAQVKAPAPVESKGEKVEKALTSYEKGIVDRQTADENRQKSIHYQSARKDAIEVTRLALENGAYTLPAKKGLSEAALLAFIDRLTVRYFEDSGLLGHVEKSDAEQAVTASVQEDE